MKQRTINVYDYDELSEKAQERAREWWRDGLDYEWWDCVYEDAADIAALFGLDIRTKLVKLMNGGTRYDPAIYFSGFWNQGDGACFEGEYRYKKGAMKAVKSHAPLDKDLHEIVQSLQEVQKRYFYAIQAATEQRGRYYHQYSMDIRACLDEDVTYQTLRVNDEETVRGCLRDFASWIYHRLRKEWEWLNSGENVEEGIRANKYEFDIEGRPI